MNKNTDLIVPDGEAIAAAHLQAAQERSNNVLRSFEQKESNLDFTDDCLEQFAALAELFKRKNSQYGSNSPLANFRNGALLTYGDDDWPYMLEVAKGYCLKHVMQVFGAGTNIDTDKIDESLGDIAVYCIIMLYMVKKYKAESQE